MMLTTLGDWVKPAHLKFLHFSLTKYTTELRINYNSINSYHTKISSTCFFGFSAESIE